ncbi:MAG: hypothetical protein JSU96_05265 [Acidobacteriota bacterium]|nr:MAG: hypothetical protein JSU96_05265 [Acidobacteriota bacterium]
MKKQTLVIALLLALASSSLGMAQEAPPSFKNMIAVGDSVTAGFQNLSLNHKGQQASYPALVARQVGTYHFLPLITEPGIPNELILVEPTFPPVVEPAPGPSGTRVFPTIIPQNIAVPGHSVMEALTTKPELPLDTLEDVILGVPALVIPQLGIPPLAQIEMAYALQPTFALFWLGSADALGAVLEADPSLVTPIEVFQQAYPQAIGALLLTGAKVVAANIPDLTYLPFLSEAELVAAVVGAPLEMIGPALGIEAGDWVTAYGLPLVPQILGGAIPGPLPPNVVLTAAEGQELRVKIATMNAIIGQVSSVLGFPVVDAHAAFAEIDQNGLQVGDVLITTSYMGGVLGLDGIHPTNTAHAFIANLHIQKMREVYGLPIPLVNLEAVAAADPLFPPNIGPQSAGTLLSMDQAAFSQLSEAVLPKAVRERRQGGFSSGDDPEMDEGSQPMAGFEGIFNSTFTAPAVQLDPGPISQPKSKAEREVKAGQRLQ